MDKTTSRRKRLVVHASQLVPFDRPYIEPEDIGISPENEPEPEDPVTPPDDRAARARKRRALAINNAWELAKLM